MQQIKSVNIFRLMGVICVIAGHTMPFYNLENSSKFYDYLAIVINIMIRFVVPFFCIISGYFWGTKILRGKDPISSANQMGKRLSLIFVGWSIIYLLPYNITVGWQFGILGPIKVAYWDALHTFSNPVQLLFQGTKPHLWFFVSLLFGVYITAVFVKFKLPAILILLSIFLYAFGVLAKAYELTPIGLEAHFNTRDGPFFGTVAFATGYFMSRLKPTSKWLYYGFCIFCIGMCLHSYEVYFLWRYYSLGPIQDYVFTTYFMGLGIAVISLSNHPKLQNDSLNSIGKMTLGIFASHFIFVDLLKFVDKKLDHPAWDIGYVVIVLIFSIALTHFLSKVKWVRKIVV